MSLMNVDGIDKQNNEALLAFLDRFWGFDKPSTEFIKNRIQTDSFDAEFSKLMKDSKDQRVRFEIDFTEPALMSYYSERDEAYKMFSRRFARAIDFLRNNGIDLNYKSFMDNKIIYKKNETKLKKIFEIIYKENPKLFFGDAERSSSSTLSEETISSFIVSAFENIGTMKKPKKKLQLVLSLNVCDWLLASSGGDISSCLNLEGGHRFWSGLPFMAGDPNRAMLYITDGNKKTFEGITVDNAMTRTWVILTKDLKKCLVRWYTSDIISIDGIKNITGDDSFQMGMKTSGKNEIEPLHLNSGLVATIYMDSGCWEPNHDRTKFVHTMNQKGCFQVFSEDLNMIKDFNFSRPWGGDLSWRISHFKTIGVTIDDTVPITRCKSCGSKKMSVKNGSSSIGNICYTCFNKKYYICSICGNSRENEKVAHDGLFLRGGEKAKGKICFDCLPRLSKCDCCGTLVDGNTSTYKTTEKKVVCGPCLEDKSNGYKKCSTCGKVSKTAVFTGYNHETKCLSEFCAEHKPKDSEDIEKNGNSFTVFTRKPFVNHECSICHALLPKRAMIGSVCVVCASSSKEVESLEG